MSVPDPALTDWVPLYPAGAQPIPPLVENKWLKSQGGAMVWSDLPAASLPARLGPTFQTITDWNLATENGWYQSSGAANAPSTEWWCGIVSVHDPPNYVTQDIWCFTDDPYSANGQRPNRRVRLGGAWSPWYPMIEFADDYEANETISSTTPAMLPSWRPYVSIPRPGWYDVDFGCQMIGPADKQCCLYYNGTYYTGQMIRMSGNHGSISRSVRLEFTVASNLHQAYWVDSLAGQTVQHRFIRARKCR